MSTAEMIVDVMEESIPSSDEESEPLRDMLGKSEVLLETNTRSLQELRKELTKTNSTIRVLSDQIISFGAKIESNKVATQQLGADVTIELRAIKSLLQEILERLPESALKA